MDVEAVIRYFVVHNYVVNGDSYTGSMIHNYYLYEDNGQLSMIPWDYNLAFGTFQGNRAASAVNDDIDSPLSVTGNDRPMIDWIFSSEEYEKARKPTSAPSTMKTHPNRKCGTGVFLTC